MTQIIIPANTNNSISKVADFSLGSSKNSLFIGSVQAANDPFTIKEYKIVAILTVASEITVKPGIGFPHKIIKIEDNPNENIYQYFSQCNKFIGEHLLKGNVLVHCRAGISRSATIVLAFMMKNKRMSLKRAFDHLKSVRLSITIEKILEKAGKAVIAKEQQPQMIFIPKYDYTNLKSNIWIGSLMKSPSKVRSLTPINSKLFDMRYYQGQKCIQRFSYMLIRPPRFVYSQKIIDPSSRYKTRFKHLIYNIPFPLSVYLPQNVSYIILYLHGNSSSRYQAFNNLTELPQRVGMACFDFNGCGNRTEKQFISLGLDQSKEVDSAVIFLRSKGYKVALWGRSMGAVSALLSTQADVVVADSAFSSLYETSKELVGSQIPCICCCCFYCLFPCFFWAVGKDVEEKSNFHPFNMEIYKYMEQANINRNILFLAAKNDQIIHYRHTQKLYQHFPGAKKKKLIFQGNHNSQRPSQIISQVFSFYQQYFNGQSIEKYEQIPSNFTQKTQNASLQALYRNSDLQKISIAGFSEQINEINYNL